jgi:NADPH:quinone reductase-like Zn-dependent oxidoreductase
MKAIVVRDADSQPALTDVVAPQPRPGQVVVRLQASSINWIDGGIAGGMLKGMMPHEFPITLGRDFAGVVEQVGEGVSTVAVGDEVFGEIPMGPPVQNGAWAELVVSSEQSLVRKPAGVDTASAGAAPLAGITAIMVADALKLSQGDTVLVIGATGGVGSIVVQLARAAGATVIASGRPEDETFLRDLGVAEVLPRDGDVVAEARSRYPDGVDALVDTVTSYQPTAFDGALKEGGRVASPTNAAGEGPGRTNVMHRPSVEILTRLAQYLADGTVRIPITATYTLDDALTGLGVLTTSSTRGKLAVKVG